MRIAQPDAIRADSRYLKEKKMSGTIKGMTKAKEAVMRLEEDVVFQFEWLARLVLELSMRFRTLYPCKL